jgi:hypothetical protein
VEPVALCQNDKPLAGRGSRKSRKYGPFLFVAKGLAFAREGQTPPVLARFTRARCGFSLGLVAIFILLVAAPACSNSPKIPGTEIPDTEENRAVVSVLERYRTAFVQKDAARVLATAHKTYHDEAGTDDPQDDLTYPDLGSILRRRMAQVDSIRFTMDYLEVQVSGDRATARVWIDASFKMKPLLAPDGVPRSSPQFSRKQDFNEFTLLLEGETWLITHGM